MIVDDVLNTLFPNQKYEIMSYWHDYKNKYAYNKELGSRKVKSIRATNDVIEIFFD